MNLNITGKYALVTGSSRGTGEVIANHLEAEGARLVRHANTLEHYEYLNNTYPDSLAIWGDITTLQGCEQSVSQLWQYVPHIDILVNNYGLATGGSWKNYREEVWLESYQKNLLSSVRITHALMEGMKQNQWGRIIQLATLGTLSPNAIMPHYYAAKAAMANITVSLAKELAGSGITVNTISPGLILTEEVKAAYMLKASKKGLSSNWEDIEQTLLQEEFPNLNKRIARPDEIAKLVCFLASEHAASINAQNIRIDGGSLAITV